MYFKDDSLNPIVDYLVDKNQVVFMQGRTMIHNVLICHDLLRHTVGKTLTDVS